MFRVRVDLDVGRDRRFFSQAVPEDIPAGDSRWGVAVGHDIDAGGADREDRNLEAFGQRVDGDGRVGKGWAEEREQLALLDESLGNLSRLRPIRGVVLDVEGDLGTIHPARIVDLVNRQEHPVPRAGAVDAAGASYREDRAERDRLTLVRIRGVGTCRGGAATGGPRMPP